MDGSLSYYLGSNILNLASCVLPRNSFRMVDIWRRSDDALASAGCPFDRPID